MALTDFEKLMSVKRRTFTVEVEIDDSTHEVVALEFQYSKKSQQAILFDAKIDDKTLKFVLELSEGKADLSKRPSTTELQKVECAIGNHFILNELISPNLEKDQAQQLIQELDPSLLRLIYAGIKDQAFPEAKN